MPERPLNCPKQVGPAPQKVTCESGQIVVKIARGAKPQGLFHLIFGQGSPQFPVPDDRHSSNPPRVVWVEIDGERIGNEGRGWGVECVWVGNYEACADGVMVLGGLGHWSNDWMSRGGR
jgi:hypothetical protein